MTQFVLDRWPGVGTLHLFTANDFPLYVAARNAHTVRRPPSYFKYHGVTPAELETIIAGVPVILDESGLTRDQLAEAIAERAHNPKLGQVLRSGWGALLKPSAFRGDLCFLENLKTLARDALAEAICLSRRFVLRAQSRAKRHLCATKPMAG